MAASPLTTEFSEEELGRLPVEAQMALAARLSLRILPALGFSGNFPWENALEDLHLFEQAISILIRSSSGDAWQETNISIDEARSRVSRSGLAVASDAASCISDCYSNNIPSAIRFAESSFAEAVENKPESLAIRIALNSDFDYLKQLSMSKPGVTRSTLELFFGSALWPERQTREWQAVENNFQNALKEIGFPELFEGYKSGGFVYFTKPGDEQRPASKIAAESISEEIQQQADIAFPPYLSQSVFSIHTHRVEPALGVEKQANIIAGLLENFQDEKGQFVGIFGQWGRGKTYFWEQVQKYLEGSEKQLYKMVTFQAWKYQDTPASWAYLYETLARCYYKDTKMGKLFLAFKRGHWKKPLYALLLSILLDITAHLVVPSAIGFGYLIFSTSVIWNYIVKKEYSTKAVDLFQKLTKTVSFEGFLGTQAEIQKELIILFKTWFPDPQKKKLLLFVDDIDRCDESRIIQIVDAIRVMLEDNELVKRLVVVAAVDERILMRAIRNKYYELVFKSRLGTLEDRKNQLEALTREYMDKLFITGIKLPQLTSEELKQYLFKLAKKLRVRPALKTVLETEAPKEKEAGKVQDSTVNTANTRVVPPAAPEETTAANEIISGKETAVPEEYDLTNEELDVIQESLLALPRSATPRQIRIFTYRYMMAIRLFRTTSRFESLYFEKGIFNIEENRLLAFLILEYGLVKSVHNLLDLKRELLKDEQENVTFTTLNKSFTRTKENIKQLFEVLEMVIAY